MKMNQRGVLNIKGLDFNGDDDGFALRASVKAKQPAQKKKRTCTVM